MNVWRHTVITTTNHTTPTYACVEPLRRETPLSEAELREIVRKEIAELPIKYDVPDTPDEP